MNSAQKIHIYNTTAKKVNAENMKEMANIDCICV